jgi:hypothetical protein
MQPHPTTLVEDVSGEFANAELGDERRVKRLLEIVGALDASPSAGFPRALGSEAELEGFYRFINNDDFEMCDVLAPHIAATLVRAHAAERVVVVHDTSSIEYTTPSPRKGLGWTTARGRQGFLAHVSLVLTTDGLPLGIGHVETLTRSGKKQRARTNHHKVISSDETRESLRWVRGIDAIEDAGDDDAFEAVHVADAEGDFFELFARMNEQDTCFVIRAGHLDRWVRMGAVDVRLREAVNGIAAQTSRRVVLGERGQHGERPRAIARRHPARQEREAKLAVGSTRVTLVKSRYSDFEGEPFDVNVVRVWEPRPPAGAAAIEWVLFTSEDVSTRAELLKVVDTYRLRWTIEEYFKALKTGCSLERRQVESYGALCKVFALFVPIAYRLLFLRGLQRKTPTAKVTSAFSATEIHLMCNAPSNRALAPPITIADGLTHLARLGGHLKNNGPPGWSTLGGGYEKLLMLRLGWELALQSTARCDQS